MNTSENDEQGAAGVSINLLASLLNFLENSIPLDTIFSPLIILVDYNSLFRIFECVFLSLEHFDEEDFVLEAEVDSKQSNGLEK